MTSPALRFRAAVFFAALVLASCDLPGRPGPEPEVLRPEQVLDFRTLYSRNCAGCHGAEGRGGAAVSLADPVYLAYVDDATVRRVTANGVAQTLMPAFARSAGGMLTDQQIEVLVKGIRGWAKPEELGGGKPPAYTAAGPGDVKRGEAAYETFCARCHGPDGKGGSGGHSIVDGSFLALISDQGLRTAVVTGVPGLEAPDWRNDVPGRPMTEEEVTDVVAWLASQRPVFPGQPYPALMESQGGRQ